MSSFGRGTILSLAVALLATLSPAVAEAEEIRFAQNDVPTVFFINKSDDHNRVDYAIRLNAECLPATEDAVFQYWREFENSPPVRTHGLNMMERIAYGISEQHIIKREGKRDEYTIRLKQLPRPLVITTEKGTDGKCSASAKVAINGTESKLVNVYVKLGGFINSVDYIEIHGKNLTTNQAVMERVKK
jgi:hypothetical protein